MLAAFASQAATVYKWTDAAGVVHFSDQPAPGAEKITTASGTSDSAAPAGNSAAGPAAGPKAAAVGPQLQITSPAPEETFFGDEVINIALSLEPALKPSQAITWHLNGKQLDDQPADATHFSLQSLSRGSYVIAATVTDQDSGESQTSSSVTFYVRQPSELSPQHRKN